MAGIFGILGLQDNDRSFVNVIGQELVFTAANTWLSMASAEILQAYAIFIESETESFKERYKLPGGGRLQRRGGQAPSAAVKAYGGWDVAYPLEDFGAQVAWDDVAVAHLRMDELQRHLDTIRAQSINTVRFEILKRLFNNTNFTFADDINGSLTVVPLANGDAVVYPPILGSEAEATESHYYGTNYLSGSISDTNNPFVTARNELEEHFGTPTGFGNTVAFINSAEVAKTEALTDYDQVNDNFIRVGGNADVPQGLPVVPGRVIGRTNGVWVVEWRWIPANYILALDLDSPKPLKMRVDPADTGLPRGLQLVQTDRQFPLIGSHYRHRFGLGTANRLNGVAQYLVVSTSYTIPTAYV